MRGEYPPPQQPLSGRPELPPHARRIPFQAGVAGSKPGTTSACAENTFSLVVDVLCAWNYLRMRGEYSPPTSSSSKTNELPPHARRILKTRMLDLGILGTTSACAENTFARLTRRLSLGNYLRMRGEYLDMTCGARYRRELPPHARRIRPRRPCRPHRDGTTSACAENTAGDGELAEKLWNYLRMRGEYRKVM